MLIDSLENKQKILKEFLDICQSHGWNQDTLNLAFEQCKIDPNLSALIFENGCLDLANLYIEQKNQESDTLLKKNKNFLNGRIRDKIRLSLYARFEVEKDSKLILQRLSRYYFSCNNLTNCDQGIRPIASGITHHLKISDFIWNNIGDHSTDLNYYSKRIILAKISFATLMVFYNDYSNDLSKTKEYIDKQIDKVMNFEKFKSSMKQKLSSAKGTFENFAVDDQGQLKSLSKIFKDLPFIRLFS